jgi:Tannase-like family of unknown function (DUF6351)
MRYPAGLAASALAIVCLLAALPHAAGDPLTVATISSRADLVSGGDALVEIRGAGTAKASVTVNGRDATPGVSQRPLAGTYLRLPLAAPASTSTSAQR